MMPTRSANEQAIAESLTAGPSGFLTRMKSEGMDIHATRTYASTSVESYPQVHVFEGLGPAMFGGLLAPDGTLVEVNWSPLEAAGLRPEDVIGKPIPETHWWAHSQEVQQQLAEAMVRAAHSEASRYDVRTRGTGDQFIDMDFSLCGLCGFVESIDLRIYNPLALA